MATRKLCIASVLLSLHAANSYILLTANLEDVHALAKQIAQSPVASQLNKIIRQASSVFNQQFNKGGSKMQLRADPKMDADTESDDDFDVWKPNPKDQIALRSKMSESSASEMSAEANENKPNRVEEKHQTGVEGKQQVKVEAKQQQVFVEGQPPAAERRKHVGVDRRYQVGADSRYQVGAERRHHFGVDRRNQAGPDLVELGKNASFYLKSIKKIFENV